MSPLVLVVLLQVAQTVAVESIIGGALGQLLYSFNVSNAGAMSTQQSLFPFCWVVFELFGQLAVAFLSWIINIVVSPHTLNTRAQEKLVGGQSVAGCRDEDSLVFREAAYDLIVLDVDGKVHEVNLICALAELPCEPGGAVHG